MCAPVMVELEGETDPLQIAMKELKLVAYAIQCFYKFLIFVALKHNFPIACSLYCVHFVLCFPVSWL